MNLNTYSFERGQYDALAQFNVKTAGIWNSIKKPLMGLGAAASVAGSAGVPMAHAFNDGTAEMQGMHALAPHLENVLQRSATDKARSMYPHTGGPTPLEVMATRDRTQKTQGLIGSATGTEMVGQNWPGSLMERR